MSVVSQVIDVARGIVQVTLLLAVAVLVVLVRTASAAGGAGFRVLVAGTWLKVRGEIVNGVFRIGTFFIP